MLKLATFRVDCTPPAGFRISFGDNDAATGIRDPLSLRGFILEADGNRYVIASLDYCALMNSAHDLLLRDLACALDIPESHVVVHCIHQHDAPLINFEIEPLLIIETYPKDWWQEVTQRCADAARTSLGSQVDIACVGHAEIRLHGYASNRRIMGSDGKVKGVRYSRCDNPELRNAPVGIIDPMLRTVAFKDTTDHIVASMSFYASHPQVSNERHLYSADAPGEAMRLVTAQHPNGLHAFCTGAGGNVTAGKYSSPDDLEGNLLTFGKRLANGVSHNLDAMQWTPASRVEWRTDSFPFPARAMDTDAMHAICANAEAQRYEKIIAAVLLSSREYEKNRNYPLTLLRVGNARILLLPGELFVEYQLFAQSVVPDNFLALAANCSDNFLYLPLAKHLDEGGYETTSFCWCTQDFEQRFKTAVTNILR